MKKQKLELRMYFLCMYNLSDIQKSIQSLHAVVEYQLKYGKDKEYQDWAKNHKTVIILNGGTSNKGTHSEYGEVKQLGSMEQHFQILKNNKIKCTAFYEPDLNHSMSAIAFLVDERVFNKKDYPDFVPTTIQKFGEDVFASDHNQFDKEYEKFLINEKKNYVKLVGTNISFLKEFLKQFKFA